MESAVLSYLESEPSEDLSALIHSHWEFRTADVNFGTLQHEIFPDGCVSLTFHRNLKTNLAQLFISGPRLESMTAPIVPNDVFWGMRLSPAACSFLLRIDPARLSLVRAVDESEFPRLTEGLVEKLCSCENFEDAIVEFEHLIRNLSPSEKTFDAKVLEAVALIEATSGEIRIAELASRVGLSQRQFERRFKKTSGLSPKQFARTRRIRAAAVNLVEQSQLNWAERAAETGFSDQSHLTHEFVSVTKRSPRDFADKVRQIKHGKLLK